MRTFSPLTNTKILLTISHSDQKQTGVHRNIHFGPISIEMRSHANANPECGRSQQNGSHLCKHKLHTWPAVDDDAATDATDDVRDDAVCVTCSGRSCTLIQQHHSSSLAQIIIIIHPSPFPFHVLYALVCIDLHLCGNYSLANTAAAKQIRRSSSPIAVVVAVFKFDRNRAYAYSSIIHPPTTS